MTTGGRSEKRSGRTQMLCFHSSRLWLKTASALPLEEYDPGGHRHIERGNDACHRNAQQNIAMLFDELVQSQTFAAEHDHRGRSEVRFAIDVIAAFVQPINPVAFFLQTFQGLADVANANYRQVFERAGSGFRDGFGESGGTAIGNQNGRCAGGMRGSDDGAQVVRIFHAIQYHQQSRPFQNLVEPGIFLRGAERHDALMRGAIRSAVERIAGFEAHRHGTLAGQIHNFLYPRTACAAGDQNAVERSAGAKGFPYRMDPGQDAGVAFCFGRRRVWLAFRSYQCKGQRALIECAQYVGHRR